MLTLTCDVFVYFGPNKEVKASTDQIKLSTFFLNPLPSPTPNFQR